jgi:hypothetical protein
MSRLRFSLISAALIVGMGALTLDSRAQAPGPGGGQGGQRGGFGRGGPGGFGGFGGFGGPFGSLLGLANMPAVQEDLKLDETQKAKVKSLNEANQKQSQEIRTQFGMGGRGPNGGGPPGGGAPGGGPPRGGPPGGNFNPNQPGGNANADNGGQAVANGGQDPGNGGQGPGNGRRNRGGFGPGGQPNPEMMQRFQAMREAMNELRQSTEQALAKILSRGQVGRLRQIQLQLEGPSALVRDEIAEKINLDEVQVESIRELMNERRQMQRENGQAQRELFRQMRPNNPNQNADAGNNADNPGNANPGNNNGGNGNRGNNRRFDPEAFRKFMEQPEVKAKMDEFRTGQQKVEDQFVAAVNKVLSPRQRANYKKMLGAPFDRTKMGGPWGGPGGRGGPGNQAVAKGATKTAPAKSASDDEGSGDDDAAAVRAPTAKPATPAATRPRAKSLRERRGLGNSSDDE